ncbi:MAG: FAD-dependent oxidoreductase [Bacteroidota bacterium]|nr:FAD-dependent oxidoreductase [Bacteroidota bacterium]
MNTKSIWAGVTDAITFTPLQNDLNVDVAIIGGGITGITAAYLLSKAGKRVAVLEAWDIARGSTGFSTGNLYAPVGEHLYKIEQSFDEETMRAVASSRSAAVDFIEQRVNEFNINCHFQRVPWYLFSTSEDGDSTVEKERDAARRCNLPVSDGVDASFPFAARTVLRIDNQAQFNPLQYTQTLANSIQNQNCQIFERTKVTKVEKGSPCVVHTDMGKVIAQQVIMATHTPKGVYGVHTAMGPYREYALAVRLKPEANYPTGGIYWEQLLMEHYSIRPYADASGNYLLILGEPHKVGQKEHTGEQFQKLEQVISARFPIDAVEYTWSAQNYKPSDKLPFIGPDGANSNVYIATGFAADGLTYGTLAAMIISDQILGQNNPWSKIYDANRFTPVASAAEFAKENINVAFEFIKDYISGSDVEHFADIAVGDGKISELNGDKVAAYRDEQNQLHVVSAICPHMKCVVHFNAMYRTWDCPCHGSRFTIDGDVIEGPAYDPLKRKEVKAGD